MPLTMITRWSGFGLGSGETTSKPSLLSDSTALFCWLIKNNFPNLGIKSISEVDDDDDDVVGTDNNLGWNPAPPRLKQPRLRGGKTTWGFVNIYEINKST